jgi:MFS family permease
MRTLAFAERTDPTTPVGRNRAFRLLLAGSSVSMLGSRMTTIAYPMLVLYLTGSPVTAGWVAFAATAPSVLVYMPAGALVDRADPRRVMLLSEFGRGVAVATVVVTVALGRPSILLLVVTAVIEEILEVFSTLAERRYVCSLVKQHQASSALVRIEARTHVVVLAGRPLGGFLFELEPILPFFFDTVSFIISIGALIGIKSRRSIDPVAASFPGIIMPTSFLKRIALKFRVNKLSSRPDLATDRQLRNDMKEGLHWLRHNRFARTAVALSASTTLICQALIMIFLANAHAQHTSSLSVGIVLAASGAGGVLGSMTASRWSAPPWCSWIQLQMCTWSAAFMFLVISGRQSFILTAASVMIILGFTGALGNIELDAYLMQNAAESMQARITSIGRVMSFGACAIGPVLGGILVHLNGMRSAVFFLFAMTAALAAVSILNPSMRSRRSYAPDGVSVMQS